ncbi:MAG TPA: amino acid transporter [Gemmatales bacterium]|nr:amino acid transporter [Gemmatales bacterium]
MSQALTITPASRTKTSPWGLVLCLVGIDYFSTLAYLPSLANEVAGPLAPLAAAAVVAVTFLLALPAYLYVVGRSSDGRGATGLMQKSISGWRGKFLILVMMGFVAADFIITRSLSTSDASVHLLANPHFQSLVDDRSPTVEALQPWIGSWWVETLRPYWNRQVGVTLLLSTIGMVFWFVFASGFTRRVLWFAAIVVAVYLAATGYLVGRVAWEVYQHQEIWHAWWLQANQHSSIQTERLVVLMLLMFPQLALGISGFELCMTSPPLIDGGAGDEAAQQRRRIRRSRWMMAALTLIMAVFLIASTWATTLVIPDVKFTSEHAAQHRALAFIAHGELFPSWFGTFYDLITAVILCLAGVSVTVGLRDLVPGYLHRLGMEMTWARKYGVFLLMCNAIILLATLVFKASVGAQMGAYATSVLVLLAGANLAAAADLRKRFIQFWMILASPFVVGLLFFVAMAGIMIWRQPGGLILSSAFLALVFLTSFWSRWRRSLELRFTGFKYADAATEERWKTMIDVEYQILVPHRPGHMSVWKKDEVIRERFRIAAEVPIIFIEVELGDTSEFEHAPLMRIDKEHDMEVIRVSKCSSISHVIAAISLEFSKFGRPPEVIFGWSNESPLAANLNFLFMGHGNIPWMVQELIRKAEASEPKRPRVIIG